MSNQSRRSSSESSGDYTSDEEEETSSKQQGPPKPKQAQKEESDDTDSDEEAGNKFTTVKRDVNSGGAAKVSVTDNNPSSKRGRDVNGGKGVPLEEPASKKRKEAKDEKARAQPLKPASPLKVEKGVKASKGTGAAKAEKAKAVPAVKAESTKPAAGSRKRKASPAPVDSMRLQAQKVETEKPSPVKAKKPIRWTTSAEESLANQLLEDKHNGIVLPNSKIDPYWEKLLKRLPHEGDVTEVQVHDKVVRMRSRHKQLKDMAKEDGGKHFKNDHEGKLFQIWEGIWGLGTVSRSGRANTSQPATEEDDSEDESAGTATTPGKFSKAVGAQGQREESSSEDETEEDDGGNVKRKTAGLNQINADGKAPTETAVVSPFVSKPRLEFTPLIAKDEKRKVSKKVEEVISGDQHTGDVLAGDDGRKGDVSALTNEHLKQLRAETLTFLQEVRENCFQLVEEIRGDRFGSIATGAGNFIFGRGFGNPGILEGLVSSNGSEAAVQLEKKWREHKVQELALVSQRLQLLQEQCHLQQEELKLQNRKLAQQEKLK